jgi:hypothetical protein
VVVGRLGHTRLASCLPALSTTSQKFQLTYCEFSKINVKMGKATLLEEISKINFDTGSAAVKDFLPRKGRVDWLGQTGCCMKLLCP